LATELEQLHTGSPSVVTRHQLPLYALPDHTGPDMYRITTLQVPHSCYRLHLTSFNLFRLKQNT
jgi:hypothetical protein